MTRRLVAWLDRRQRRIATAYAARHRAPISPTASFTTRRSAK